LYLIERDGHSWGKPSCAETDVQGSEKTLFSLWRCLSLSAEGAWVVKLRLNAFYAAKCKFD